MKQKLLLSLFMLASFVSISQNVIIPDVNFKSYLVNNPAINTNSSSGDTEIQITEAIAFSGTIDVLNLGITDLTGIEAFINLEILIVTANQLSSVDTSANTALKEFYVDDNQLTSLDISSNIALEKLDADNNQLTSIDVSGNSTLKEFNATANQLTAIDVSNLSQLEILRVGRNSLTSLNVLQNTNLFNLTVPENNINSLDISQNINLITLNVEVNNLSLLDVTQNINLESLFVGGNNLSVIDLSQNLALERFNTFFNTNMQSIDFINNVALFNIYIEDSAFTTLDFSSNINLEEIEITNNSNLSSLDLSNGNNANVTFASLAFNSNLSCIQIDANFTPSTSIWSKDATAVYSDNCAALCTVNIPDANFKAALLAHGTTITIGGATPIDTNVDGEIQCSEASAYTNYLFVANQSISDFTGIEAFTSVTGLDCSNNNAVTVDVSQNIALEYFICGGNNMLSNLDVSNNVNLISLFCTNSSVANIDLSFNTALSLLNFIGSDLTELDVSNNPNMNNMLVTNNNLYSLNVANGNNVNWSSNMGAANNPNLSCVQTDPGFVNPPINWVIDATASYSDNCAALCTVNIPDANFKAALVANTAINLDGDGEIQCAEASAFAGSINVGNQGISDLTGLEAFTAATTIDFSNNSVVTVDFSFTNSFETIFAFNTTTLTTIDISGSANLDTFSAAQCAITALDTSNNSALRVITLTLNNLTVLDVSMNPLLEFLLVSSNQITALDLSSNSSLKTLNVEANGLTELNIANGNNAAITSLDANVNPNLTCIQIDSGFTPPSNWQKDATATYSDNCANLSVNDFETTSFKLYPNPVTDVLLIESNKTIKILEIYSVTGKRLAMEQNTSSINVSEFNNGIYFIKIISEDGNASTLKFLKK